MKTCTIPVERIKKAQIRYYDVEHNGVEIPELKAYTIFIKMGDMYVNLFNSFLEFNVYERVPYYNTTSNGEDFGSKIRLIQGKVESGECYVLESKSMTELEGMDTISIDALYKIILKSEDFYADRMELLYDHPYLVSYCEKKKIIKKDLYKMGQFMSYLESKKNQKNYNK